MFPINQILLHLLTMYPSINPGEKSLGPDSWRTFRGSFILANDPWVLQLLSTQAASPR